MRPTDNESDDAPPAPDAPSSMPAKKVIDRTFALGSSLRVGESTRAFNSLANIRELLPSTQIEKLLGPSPAQLAMTEAFRLPSVIDEVMRQQQEAVRAIQMPSVGSVITEVLADQERQRRDMLRALDPVADIGRIMREQQAQLAAATQHALLFAKESPVAQALALTRASGALAMAEEAQRQIKALTQVVDFDLVGSQIRAFQTQAQELAELFLRLPWRLRKNLLALARAGWFLDPEMPMPDVLHWDEELLTRTAEEVDAELAEYFDIALARIEETLTERHPYRATLITQAFAAHRAGWYSVSIPAFLIQAEGVCFDCTGRQLFNGSGPKTEAAKFDDDSIDRIYLDLLSGKLPLTEGTKVRSGKDWAGLSRHAVLHGESVDFGTKTNGLRAISFLNFVSHAFDIGMQEEEAGQDEGPASPG
jgi:hypothetical protein